MVVLEENLCAEEEVAVEDALGLALTWGRLMGWNLSEAWEASERGASLYVLFIQTVPSFFFCAAAAASSSAFCWSYLTGALEMVLALSPSRCAYSDRPGFLGASAMRGYFSKLWMDVILLDIAVYSTRSDASFDKSKQGRGAWRCRRSMRSC